MFDITLAFFFFAVEQTMFLLQTTTPTSNNRGLPDAVLVGAAGGAGIVIAKTIDWFIARSSKTDNKEQMMYTRQRELDLVKDNLIGVFQTQISDLREQIDELIDKNRQLHEENIKLRYEVADCNLQIGRLKEKLGIHNGG